MPQSWTWDSQIAARKNYEIGKIWWGMVDFGSLHAWHKPNFFDIKYLHSVFFTKGNKLNPVGKTLNIHVKSK